MTWGRTVSRAVKRKVHKCPRTHQKHSRQDPEDNDQDLVELRCRRKKNGDDRTGQERHSDDPLAAHGCGYLPTDDGGEEKADVEAVEDQSLEFW